MYIDAQHLGGDVWPEGRKVLLVGSQGTGPPPPPDLWVSVCVCKCVGGGEGGARRAMQCSRSPLKYTLMSACH